jgi:CRAL/TRIO domain
MFATNNSESLSLQQRLHTEMKENQAFVTRGYDTDGHAILFAFSRKQNSGNDADLAFVDAIVYAMERACAATEYHTNGRKDKVVVVIDTQASASPPSLQATKRCAQILQTYYPGRLLKLVVWNPPFVLHALHKCIKPFLDPETASKFVFCKGERQVRDTMDKVLGRGDPSSQFWEVREVDCDHFLNQVPFHSSYCENKQHTAATSAASSRTSSETELQDCPQVGDPSAGPTTAINVNARTLAVGELLHRPGVNEHEDEDQYHVVKLTRVVA